MKVVLDTDVIVSGHLSPHGPPGEILARVISDELVICYDARIFAEYDEVLHRPYFDFSKDVVQSFLDTLQRNGEQTTGLLASKQLTDPDDTPFLEVALAARAPLVTGNIKHFPSTHRQGAPVLTPSEFMGHLRKQ